MVVMVVAMFYRVGRRTCLGKPGASDEAGVEKLGPRVVLGHCQPVFQRILNSEEKSC